MRITYTNARAPRFKQDLAGIGDRMHKAMGVAANMAASMIKAEADEDIRASGDFGERWTSGLHVNVESTGALNNMRISMYHDIEFAGIFETGGSIYGNPLLWLPLSGTDAEGTQAGAYPDKLFSAVSSTGLPLLFSMYDKKPKYFGVPAVTISRKWHLREIQANVMKNFKTYFMQAFRKA